MARVKKTKIARIRTVIEHLAKESGNEMCEPFQKILPEMPSGLTVRQALAWIEAHPPVEVPEYISQWDAFGYYWKDVPTGETLLESVSAEAALSFVGECLADVGYAVEITDLVFNAWPDDDALEMRIVEVVLLDYATKHNLFE